MAPAAAMPTTYLDGFNAHASVEADMNHHNNHIHRPHTLDALDTMTRKRKSMVWTLELVSLIRVLSFPVTFFLSRFLHLIGSIAE